MNAPDYLFPNKQAFVKKMLRLRFVKNCKFIGCLILIMVGGNAYLNAQNVNVKAYGAHVEFEFTHPLGSTLAQVRRQTMGEEPFVKLVPTSEQRYLDFLGVDKQDQVYNYSIIWDHPDKKADTIAIDSVVMVAQTDSAFLDMVQAYTFRYFWEFAHPVSGLIRERNRSGRLVTMGGSGFGIMAILVGIHRKFISRKEGFERINQIVNFLEIADRFKGVFPHWMDGSTGKVIPFSPDDDGGDLVETSFLFQGLLTAREYFNQDTPEEDLLRIKITNLWEAVDFNWYRKQTQKVLFWHWSPTHEFKKDHEIRGWNEAMIIYLLGIASPTHTIPPSLYHDGWANSNRFLNGAIHYNTKLPLGPRLGGPLFFAHYSFIGFDPRGIRDQYTNYFIQNRNHTLINRGFCIENPNSFIGYGPNAWGLTASDDPDGYLAHAPGTNRDNGTISPTAAISSIPYTPSESMAAMRNFYENEGEKLWGPMGFFDAYNPTRNWVANSYLAIDQGPIICMIENYRSGLLWNYFMQNEEITVALDKIGFVKDSTTVSSSPMDDRTEFTIMPNPVRNEVSIHAPDFLFDQISIFTSQGQLISEHVFKSISHQAKINLARLPKGVYVLVIKNQETQHAKMLVRH